MQMNYSYEFVRAWISADMCRQDGAICSKNIKIVPYHGSAQIPRLTVSVPDYGSWLELKVPKASIDKTCRRTRLRGYFKLIMQEAYEADFHLYLILSDVNSIASIEIWPARRMSACFGITCSLRVRITSGSPSGIV